MKYKIGDTVKILRVGGVTDPKKNDWIGKISKIKEVEPEDWVGDYMLENGFPAREGELELVVEFKVGDKVKINCPNNTDGSLRHGAIGVVKGIDTTNTPYEAGFGKDHCYYKPDELEKIGDKFRVGDYVVIHAAPNSGKLAYVGETGQIFKIWADSEYPYAVRFNDTEKRSYYENELVLVLAEVRDALEVGDRVRVTSTARPKDSRRMMGHIHQIEDDTYPFKVRLDDEGGYYGYNDKEIEKIDSVLMPEHLSKAMDRLSRPEVYYFPHAQWIAQWTDQQIMNLVGDLNSKQEAKPKVTTAFSILGKDGLYYDAEFVDISFEMFRSYMFPAERFNNGSDSVWGRSAHIVRIDTPKWLYVAPSGSHRIIDKQGRSHYIPCGWKHLWWKVEEGK